MAEFTGAAPSSVTTPFNSPAVAGSTFFPADEAGAPVPGAGSQLGWLLWADAIEDYGAVADRLCEPDVLTDFGLRTLSSDSPVFAPDAYHAAPSGRSTWLGWGGCAAGRHEAAERVPHRRAAPRLDRLGRFHSCSAVVDGEPRDRGLQPRPGMDRRRRWALEHEWDGRA
jgi:hypothetical protein